MKSVALWQRPVSYAAVGGTKARDLLSYPPVGFRPYEGRARIGQGDARWEFAWNAVLTWGIQRRSGFRVTVTETPAEVTDLTYRPVRFDSEGEPLTAAVVGGSPVGGEHLIVPGDTALLGIPFGPFRVGAPARVVYVIDEPDRKGFAYGTIAGHPESGEESFIVERGSDGTVWLEIRAFSRPSNAFWWIVYPVLRMSQAFYTRRYFRALAGAID
jgi:uncharacterized protein (UPF0548 family)